MAQWSSSRADVAFEMRIFFVLIGIAIVVLLSLCAKFRLIDKIYGQIQKIKAHHKKNILNKKRHYFCSNAVFC